MTKNEAIMGWERVREALESIEHKVLDVSLYDGKVSIQVTDPQDIPDDAVLKAFHTGTTIHIKATKSGIEYVLVVMPRGAEVPGHD